MFSKRLIDAKLRKLIAHSWRFKVAQALPPTKRCCRKTENFTVSSHESVLPTAVALFTVELSKSYVLVLLSLTAVNKATAEWQRKLVS